MLDGLRINPRKSFTGRVRGERLTRKKGISIEFADFREYSEGDDLRHLDWNVLARLDMPVMRTYQDEEDLAVHLLLDHSPSMGFGEPTKLQAARQLACAVGYVALNGGDAVLPRALGSRNQHPRPLRGRAGYPALARWSEGLDSEAQSSDGLAKGILRFVASSARTGLVVLVSDGLDPECTSGLRALAAKGHEVWFLQVLSDLDLDPDIEGDLRLIDAETGNVVEVTANSGVLKEYQRRLRDHNASLIESMRRIGGRHVLVKANAGLEVVIRDTLRRQQWFV